MVAWRWTKHSTALIFMQQCISAEEKWRTFKQTRAPSIIQSHQTCAYALTHSQQTHTRKHKCTYTFAGHPLGIVGKCKTLREYGLEWHLRATMSSAGVLRNVNIDPPDSSNLLKDITVLSTLLCCDLDQHFFSLFHSSMIVVFLS